MIFDGGREKTSSFRSAERIQKGIVPTHLCFYFFCKNCKQYNLSLSQLRLSLADSSPVRWSQGALRICALLNLPNGANRNDKGREMPPQVRKFLSALAAAREDTSKKGDRSERNGIEGAAFGRERGCGIKQNNPEKQTARAVGVERKTKI